MTVPAPEGYVDPSNQQEVAAVLDSVLRTLGIAGIGDLLSRVPGSRVEAARRGGMFKRATPPSVWLSPEHQFELSEPIVHVHVVGGVVLAREPLPPGRLPETVARLLATAVTDQGSGTEAAVVLTAARETCERLQP
ncbi:MAG: hypothetical protein ACRDPB_04110 [Nocardioidaceae bacterium]